jgi:hypothetical protein
MVFHLTTFIGFTKMLNINPPYNKDNNWTKIFPYSFKWKKTKLINIKTHTKYAVKNLPTCPNIGIKSPQFIIKNIAKAPRIPKIPEFNPQYLSFSPKIAIEVKLLVIPVKNRINKYAYFFISNSKKEQKEIKLIILKNK